MGVGDAQWMAAGSGILHQEMPKGDRRGRMHGFQLWANLHSSLKTTDLRYQDIPSSAIPEVTDTDRTSVRPFHCSARSGDLGEQAFKDRVQVQITVNRKDIENGKHASRTSSIRREPQKGCLCERPICRQLAVNIQHLTRVLALLEVHKCPHGSPPALSSLSFLSQLPVMPTKLR
jgi:hypothetical protein